MLCGSVLQLPVAGCIASFADASVTSASHDVFVVLYLCLCIVVGFRNTNTRVCLRTYRLQFGERYILLITELQCGKYQFYLLIPLKR